VGILISGDVPDASDLFLRGGVTSPDARPVRVRHVVATACTKSQDRLHPGIPETIPGGMAMGRPRKKHPRIKNKGVRCNDEDKAFWDRIVAASDHRSDEDFSALVRRLLAQEAQRLGVK
jgi:hypothetical protein